MAEIASFAFRVMPKNETVCNSDIRLDIYSERKPVQDALYHTLQLNRLGTDFHEYEVGTVLRTSLKDKGFPNALGHP